MRLIRAPSGHAGRGGGLWGRTGGGLWGRGGDGLWGLDAREWHVVGLTVAAKVAVSAAMLFFFFQFSDFDRVANLWNRYYTQEDVSAWFMPFANWDGQHYLLLSDWQYDRHQFSRHFYPLYPGLLGVVSVVMPLPVAAVALNGLLTAGACVFLYRLGRHFDCARPRFAVVILLAFPTAFYAAAFYSEPLFMLLFMGVLYHVFVTQSRARLVYLALLPLARGTAAFVFGGLLLYAALEYVAWRRASHRAAHDAGEPAPGGCGEAPAGGGGGDFAWREHLYSVLAFVAGVAGYFLFYTLMTGDPLTGMHAQSSVISKNHIANLFNPVNFFCNLFAPVSAVFAYQFSAFDRVFMALCLSGIALFVVYKEWALLCFYAPMVYAHAAMGVGAMSYSRYALLAAPFPALVLAKHWRRTWQVRALYAACAASCAVQLYAAYRFSLNLWVA